MSESGEKTRTLISEELVLAIVPLVGYAVAYAYELGHAAVFHVPTSLISISIISGLEIIVNLLSTSGYYYAALFGIAWSIIFLYQYPAAKKRPFRNFAAPFFVAISVSLLIAPKLLPSIGQHLIGATILAIVWWSIFISKWGELEPTELSLWDAAPVGYVVATYVSLAVSLTYCVGESAALYAPEHVFVGDKQSSVLVGVSGDMIVTAPVTRDKADPKFFYIEDRLDVAKQKPGEVLRLYRRPASLEVRNTFTNW